MVLELTDREVKLLIESLRINERNSRQGFGRSLAGLSDQEAAKEKCERAFTVFKEFEYLRLRLGDSNPVSI